MVYAAGDPVQTATRVAVHTPAEYSQLLHFQHLRPRFWAVGTGRRSSQCYPCSGGRAIETPKGPCLNKEEMLTHPSFSATGQ
jgi:hypothetical protein